MKFLIVLVNLYLIIIHLLRIIKLLFNPKILKSKYFDPIITKSYLIVYYLCAILLMSLVIANRLGYL